MKLLILKNSLWNAFLVKNIAFYRHKGSSMCPISQVIFSKVQIRNSQKTAKSEYFIQWKKAEISLNIPYSLLSVFCCLCFSIVSASRPLFLLPKCVVPKLKKTAKDSKKESIRGVIVIETNRKETGNVVNSVGISETKKKPEKNNIFLVIV